MADPSTVIQKSTVTIKVSKSVRDYIQKSTALNEPIDRTLRRLLGLKIMPGDFPPKGKLRKNHYNNRRKSPVMTTVKVTKFLRDFIANKAKWNESIDHTLGRLLKMDVEKDPDSGRKKLSGPFISDLQDAISEVKRVAGGK